MTNQIKIKAKATGRSWNSERCPRCGAAVGVDCQTPSGEPCATHKIRKRLAAYLPLPVSR